MKKSKKYLKHVHFYIGNPNKNSLSFEEVPLGERSLMERIEEAQKVIKKLYDTHWTRWRKKINRIGLLNGIMNELYISSPQLIIKGLNSNKGEQNIKKSS